MRMGVQGAPHPRVTPSSGPTGESQTSGNLDGFLDHLFQPVLSPGHSVSVLHTHPTPSLPLPHRGLHCLSHLSQGSSSDPVAYGFRPYRIWSKAGL